MCEPPTTQDSTFTPDLHDHVDGTTIFQHAAHSHVLLHKSVPTITQFFLLNGLGVRDLLPLCSPHLTTFDSWRMWWNSSVACNPQWPAAEHHRDWHAAANMERDRDVKKITSATPADKTFAHIHNKSIQIHQLNFKATFFTDATDNTGRVRVSLQLSVFSQYFTKLLKHVSTHSA